MTDSKLLETLKTFNREEQEEFALFIASPYFNRGAYASELSKLYTFILAVQSDASAGTLSKTEAHANIFPDKVYSEGRIDRMMFEINKLSREFLLHRNYVRKENEVRFMVDWVAVLRQKGLDHRVEKELEKIRQQNQQQTQGSVAQFFTNFLVAREDHIWRSNHNKIKDDLGVTELIESLDTYYFSYRLELLNRVLLQQKASSLVLSPVLAAALENLQIPEHYLENSPLLHITWKIRILLQADIHVVAHFQELFDLLKAHEKDISPEILAQFYVYLRNLCAFIIDAGHTDFDPLLHTIQMDNLERGYFHHEGKISPYAFLNIVQHAIRAQNLPWAYTFVERYKDEIRDENDTRDFYRMNLALCLFAEKKYSEALEMIPFGSSYSFYHLMARRLELKIYYETRSELLPSKIDAFKMFISRVGRKNLSPNLSELLTNFGNFVSQLYQSIPGDKSRSALLEKRIREKKLVGERSWLLEKARALGR
jgi:hypothetical protein